MTATTAERRSDSRHTRQEILRVAKEMSRDRAFESIRMADLAQRVGRSRATVYNHFASRDQLLEALCTEYLAGYAFIPAQVQEWVDADHTIFEVLRETVARELRWRVAHAQLRGALDSAKRLRKDFYVREDARIDAAMLTWFGAIYAASDALGLLWSDLDLTFAGNAVYAMIDHVVAEFPVNVKAAELERAADRVARLQWHALYRCDPEASPRYRELRLRGLRRVGSMPVGGS